MDLFTSHLFRSFALPETDMLLAGVACAVLMLFGAVLGLILAVASGRKPNEEEDEEEYLHVPQRLHIPEVQERRKQSELVFTQRTEDKIRDDGVIEVLNGDMRGAAFPIHHGETHVMGKDPRVCQIVMPWSYEKISRAHCSISYDAVTKCYYVTDYSTNGTYTAGRLRLTKGARTMLHPKTVLTLGNDQCTILLG